MTKLALDAILVTSSQQVSGIRLHLELFVLCCVSPVWQVDRLSKEKNPHWLVGALLPVTAEILLSKAAGKNPSRSSGFYHQASKGVIVIHLFFPGPPQPLSLCTGKALYVVVRRFVRGALRHSEMQWKGCGRTHIYEGAAETSWRIKLKGKFKGESLSVWNCSSKK